MFLRETRESVLRIVLDNSSLPLIDSIEVQVNATVEGIVHYSAFPRQPPKAHSAAIVLQFYIDDQPYEQLFEMVVLPALVVRLPNGKDVAWSQQPGVSMETLVQLPPGKHKIAVHGGGYPNTKNDTAITISHRFLYFNSQQPEKR
jgi:hypothetical protein